MPAMKGNIPSSSLHMEFVLWRRVLLFVNCVAPLNSILRLGSLLREGGCCKVDCLVLPAAVPRELGEGAEACRSCHKESVCCLPEGGEQRLSSNNRIFPLPPPGNGLDELV